MIRPSEATPREEAAAAILEAEEMDVPQLADLLSELDDLRGRRS